MKRKKYFHFAITRVIAGLVIGAIIFGITTVSISNLFSNMIDSGFRDRTELYKKLIDNYDNGRYDETFLEIITNIYRADYLKFAKINEDGNIETIYETRYDVIPIEDNIYSWLNVTNDEALLAQGQKTMHLNDKDWVIKYVKCDEAWQLTGIMATDYTNCWDLCALSDGYYANKMFYIATELSGYLTYGQPVIKSQYVDGDTLHIGKVSQVNYDPDFTRPFSKKWDFTDQSKADLYTMVDAEGFANDLYLYERGKRPDAYLNDLEKIFLAKNLDELTSEFDSRFGDDYDWDRDLDYTRYYAYGGPDNSHPGEYSYSITTEDNTKGKINIYMINGQQYLVEFVMKTAPFEAFYQPFLILFAIILFVLCAGIALLTAIRSYSQYKKAYENNIFKNNLIDSLAHNMKTPLQILGGYAENLKDVDGDEKDRYADQILEKTTEMNRDIEAILKTAEKSDRKFAKASVRTCIEEVASKLGSDIEIKGDTVIKMDKDYFKTALSCLIDNANKYKAEGSKIDVAISGKAFTIKNKTDAGKFTPGTGLAIAGRILEQHKLYLETALKDGVFEARITKKPAGKKQK